MRAFNLDGAEIDLEDDDPFNKYILSVSYAICSAYHQTHGFSPGQLVFGRGMFLDTRAEIDWDAIRERKQRKIQKSNEQENKNRIDIWYKKGDLILKKKPGIIRKLSIPYAGPYKVSETTA